MRAISSIQIFESSLVAKTLVEPTHLPGPFYTTRTVLAAMEIGPKRMAGLRFSYFPCNSSNRSRMYNKRGHNQKWGRGVVRFCLRVCPSVILGWLTPIFFCSSQSRFRRRRIFVARGGKDANSSHTNANVGKMVENGHNGEAFSGPHLCWLKTIVCCPFCRNIRTPTRTHNKGSSGHRDHKGIKQQYIVRHLVDGLVNLVLQHATHKRKKIMLSNSRRMMIRRLASSTTAARTSPATASSMVMNQTKRAMSDATYTFDLAGAFLVRRHRCVDMRARETAVV
jgi:hypothetical protein